MDHIKARFPTGGASRIIRRLVSNLVDKLEAEGPSAAEIASLVEELQEPN